MSGPIGLILPAASIGFGSLLIKPKRRGFFPTTGQPIIAQAVVEEVHHDELEITEHPVEQGAAIADHAYKRPAEVIIRCGWSNSPSGSAGLVGAAVGLASALGGTAARVAAAALPTFNAVQSLLNGNSQDQVQAIYAQMLALQATRVPFDIFTGKRAYTDMLFRSLNTSTTRDTENSLIITAVCRQVIIVSTQAVSIAQGDPANMVSPQKNGPVIDLGIRNLLPSPPTFTLPSFKIPSFNISP